MNEYIKPEVNVVDFTTEPVTTTGTDDSSTGYEEISL